MYELLEMVGHVLAGVGLFFVGLHGLSDNLKKIAGRRFRQLVARWTRSPALGLAWGSLGGAVTQSPSAMTFITVSMLAVGGIAMQNALPVLAGANLGAALMVLIATLHIEVLVLFVLGVAGIMYTHGESPGLRPLAGALLGAGLLFLGLLMLHNGATPLAEQPWFQQALGAASSAAGRWYLLIFIVGTLATVILHSSVAVAVLAIHMTSAGLFTPEQCVMLVYAANLGSGINTWMLSSNLQGRQRQLAVYQFLFKASGSVLLVPLFFVEVIGGVPLMMALAAKLANDVGRQMAWLYLLFNTVMVVIMLALQAPILRLLARLAPPSADEDADKPRYLHDHAVDEPETAIDLAEQEQLRLVQRLPGYLACVREGGDGVTARLQAQHKAFEAVAMAIRTFIDELGRRNPGRHALERLGDCLERLQLLQAMESTLYELAGAIDRGKGSAGLARLGGNVLEAVDVVLMTLGDAWQHGAAEDLALLGQLTGDRGDLMRRIRESYIDGERAASAEERLTLMHLTSLCERLFWLMGRLSVNLERRSAAVLQELAEAAA